ncbi:MAG: phytanoyl-CoA dioxygenase family protein [Alphaproteobacteria bacterium]|nr:phytanoyl-CoA dioxygenase family protein [Alphaproteobacteria bacterium]
MQLTQAQVDDYRRSGYLYFPGLLAAPEVAALRAVVPALMARGGPEIKRDGPEGQARLVYAPHTYSAPYATLSRLPRVLGAVRSLLGEDAYVYQSRINLKLPFAGDAWSWHQDFSTWHRRDGMPRPHAVMTAVFLDDCTVANGPLLVIPESHSEDIATILGREEDVQGYKVQRVGTRVIADLADRTGIVDLCGPAGSVAFIHPTLMHGSAPNMTPWSRSIFYLNYNAVSNRTVQSERPWFMNSPDTTPLTEVGDGDLLAQAPAAA